VGRRIGNLAVGDPRGVLNLDAGRRHNQRTRDWRIGHLITVLKDKAEAAGIGLQLMDERGTSSTCPACASRIPKPAGRVLTCPVCQFTGHRDLTAAASITARHVGRDHAGHPGRRHAPLRRGAPSWCRPLAT
jgi:transposase